jgi:mono/diheme cytochrome c family protein
MAVLVFVLVWVAVGLGLFFIAVSGGPRGAARRIGTPRRRGGRGVLVAFALALLVLGLGVPAAVIATVEGRDDDPEANISNLTEDQKHGRELFAQRCRTCHTLQAASAAASVGPNLDEIRPAYQTVTDAIKNGRARGNGQMPAELYQGKDAQDVAQFVAVAVGQGRTIPKR